MPDFLADLGWQDALGVVGSFLIAGAYFGVSTGRMDGERPPFQWFNLAGAGFILFSLWFRPNAGAIVIEVLWVGIAVWSLVRYYTRQR